MPLTPEAVQTYNASITGVRSLTRRNTTALWRALPASVEEATARLLSVLPAFVAQHGELASLAAVDFYDEVRSSPEFNAELLPAPASRQVEAAARWAVTPLYQSEPNDIDALSRLHSITDRLTVNQSHETIIFNGGRDPNEPRFARVPVGHTCAWCRLLASRGAVYRRRASAMATSHDRCDCKTVPVFDGDVDRLPDAYEAGGSGLTPDGVRTEYETARRAADSGSPSKILAAWRTQDGIH